MPELKRFYYCQRALGDSPRVFGFLAPLGAKTNWREFRKLKDSRTLAYPLYKGTLPYLYTFTLPEWPRDETKYD